ncbi:ABC transporter permease [Candidatus Thorarchaeota archaeon]|nr:MAG: ABC transporter permease [Candidatus Thorarchaeota archaeon]
MCEMTQSPSTSPGSYDEHSAEEDGILHSPRNFLFKLVFPVLILLVIWEVVAYVARGFSLIDVGQAFLELMIEGDTDGVTLMEHAGRSIYRVTLGFLLALVTASPLGIAIGRYRAVNDVLSPVVEALRPIPPIAWIPLSILMFRTNLVAAQVFIIWIGAFFPILLNTTTGVNRTNPVHIDVARSFGADEQVILHKIVLPSAAPEMFAGFRIGFGIGWMCLVAAEMIGGGLGLGYLVIITQQLGRTGQTISAMLMIGLIGFLISYLFLYVEKRALRWRIEVSI